MGTRSLIHFREDDTVLVTIYQQYDGDPSGVGRDLAKFLVSRKLVNGISGGDSNIANGLGCLAAQFIAAHKSGPGGLYIYPPACEDVGEEFTYYVTVQDPYSKPSLTVDCANCKPRLTVDCANYKGQPLFRGTAEEFLGFCEVDDNA